MWISRERYNHLITRALDFESLSGVVHALRGLNASITNMKEELMSALSDANDSLTALSAKVDAAIAANPAVAAALAEDEAGLVSLKSGLDALGAKIDAALTPPA